MMSPDPTDPNSDPSRDASETAPRPADRQSPPQRTGAAQRLKSSLENELAALEQELELSASDRGSAADAPVSRGGTTSDEAGPAGSASASVPSASSPSGARDEVAPDLPIGRPVEPIRPPAAAAAGSREASPGSPPEPDAAEGAPPPAGERRTLSMAEVVGLAVMALILAGGVYFLLVSPSGTGGAGDANQADRAPSPSRGEMVSLTEIDAYWRDRTASDRVDATQNILPELRVKVEPSDASGEVFLKIHFLDPDRQIAGDVRSVRISGGKLVATSRGEEIIDDATFKVAASRGFPDRTAFLTYRFGEDPRWAIEVFEGKDYASGPWNRIAYFEIPTEYREDSESGEGQ